MGKNVLIACEESQRVCRAFRKRGFNAYSCDILDCSGGCEQFHIKGDVLPLLNGNCEFTTMDGRTHRVSGKWDLIIAFPPCTHLAVSGASWFAEKRRTGEQRYAIEFFAQFLIADCDRIAIENPVNIISGCYIEKYYPDLCVKYGFPIKPAQRIQPWQYGDKARKTTCLWLKGLPDLTPTEIVNPGEIKHGGYSVGASVYYARDENGKILPWNDPRTAIIRSKTFQGIANAMAVQWGDYLKNV